MAAPWKVFEQAADAYDASYDTRLTLPALRQVLVENGLGFYPGPKSRATQGIRTLDLPITNRLLYH